MSDVEVYIRRADRQTTGSTSRWTSLTLVQRRNDVGTWTLVTSSPEDAQALSPVVDAAGDIVQPRGVIIRRDDGTGGQITVASGWCDGLPNVVQSNGRTEWTFTGWDDTVLLADTECWPLPSAPVTAQTDAYDVRTGPRSNRIRDYWIVNVENRLAIPGAVGGNQLNLGSTGTSRARFRNLLELAQEIAGRETNFAVRQRDSDRALFLFQGLPIDKRLAVQFSPQLGTVHGWSYTATPAEATRVVIGAGGEGAARGFREYVNGAEEASLGGVRKIERFKDRRDLDITNPEPGDDWLAEAAEDAAEFLEENRSRATFTIDATDMQGMRYGTDFAVGDLVRAYIDTDNDGQPVGLVDDLIEEATVTWSSQGERVDVRIGSLDDLDPTSKLARQQRIDRRRIADLEARR